MSSRERILLLVVGVLVVVVGGGAGGMLYLKKWGETNARITKAEDGIRKKQDAIAKEERELDRMHALSPRLMHWRKQSLPEPEVGKDPDAHLSRMHIAYQQYLTDVLNENGFQETKVTPGKFDNKQTPQFAKDRPVYGVKVYTVAARANLKSVIKVFSAIHNMPVLHQVKHFKLSRPIKGTDKLKDDEINVTMTIEVLQVSGAERLVARSSPDASKKKDARTDWLAKYTDTTQQPPVLATKQRNYDDMVAKHLFNLNPVVEKPKDPVKPPERPKDPETPKDPPRPREKPEDVLPFVKLTKVDYTEGVIDWDENPEQPNLNAGWVGAAVSYYAFRAPQCEAVLWNQNRMNVDEQTGKADYDMMKFRMIVASKRMRVPDFKILDKYDNLVVEGEGIRIERDTKALLVLIDRKIYRIHLGQSLLDAMKTPLEEKELKELGIAVPKEPEKTPEKKPFEQTGPFKPEEKKEEKKMEETKQPPMTEKKDK